MHGNSKLVCNFTIYCPEPNSVKMRIRTWNINTKEYRLCDATCIVLLWVVMGIKWKVRSKAMYSNTVNVVSPQRKVPLPSLGNAFMPLP